MILQRTPEWYRARIGKFTASCFSKIVSKPADKTARVSRTALNYIEKAATQLYFNDYLPSIDSHSTRWGNNHEEEAIRAFSLKTGFKTKESGFKLHPHYPDFGATPDALVEDKDFFSRTIVAQIKCPYNPKNHTEYRKKISDAFSLRKKKSEYFWQIQGEIWISDAVHGYFVSFDPRLDESENVHIVKIERDEQAIGFLKEKLQESLVLRNEILGALRAGKRQPKALHHFY